MSEQSDINTRQSKLNDTTADTVDKLVRAARWRKWTMLLLWILTIVIAIVVFKGHLLVQDVQHGAYESCLSGNSARSANVNIWTDFVNILLSGDKHLNDQAHQTGQTFLNYLQAHEKPNNCAELYPQQPWWHFWS